MAAQRSPKPLVGVRFSPPEPYFSIKELAMIIFFKRWFPATICIITVFNLIVCYGADNTAAVYANMSALIAWAILAIDEYYGAKEARRASDSI